MKVKINTTTLLQKYLSIVQRFIPQPEAKPLIGLDIGTSSCKLVELIRKGERYQLTNWAIEPIVDGNLKDAIKNIVSKASESSRSPAIAVFGKGTLIRFIIMPRMSLEELKSSFSLEADKYFPFPQDQIYMDCYILDNKGKENKMSVLIAAAKKELVDARVKVLGEVGLHPELISLNSIAIANALGTLGFKPNGQGGELKEDKPSAIAVLDMGGEVSNLTVLIDNLPRFTRDIFIGGHDLTKSISLALGIGIPEAEKLKFTPGEKLPEALSASDSILMDLISEIRLSFDYFVTERNISVPVLFFTGGGSQMAGIMDILAKQLEIKVMRWEPVEWVDLAPGISREAVSAQAGKLTVALGLALSQA